MQFELLNIFKVGKLPITAVGAKSRQRGSATNHPSKTFGMPLFISEFQGSN